jgi:hypothetical protein
MFVGVSYLLKDVKNIKLGCFGGAEFYKNS